MDSFSTAEEALEYLSKKWPTGERYAIRLANSISEKGKTDILYRIIGLFYLAEIEADDDYTIYRYETQTHWFDHIDDDYDPIIQVIDRPLDITKSTISALEAYLAEPKYEGGLVLHEGERKVLTHLVNALTKRLIDTIEENPTKLWVMKQLQVTFPHLPNGDTEVREHYGEGIYRITEILGIRSTNGLSAYYL